MNRTFEMPFLPPSVNACYRSFGKKVVKSAKLKEFEQKIIKFFDEQEGDVDMIEGKIKLTVHFHLKGKRSIDLDNLLKALIDGCENILFENDKAICEIHAYKYSNCNDVKTVIEVEQME